MEDVFCNPIKDFTLTYTIFSYYIEAPCASVFATSAALRARGIEAGIMTPGFRTPTRLVSSSSLYVSQTALVAYHDMFGVLGEFIGVQGGVKSNEKGEERMIIYPFGMILQGLGSG